MLCSCNEPVFDKGQYKSTCTNTLLDLDLVLGGLVGLEIWS